MVFIKLPHAPKLIITGNSFSISKLSFPDISSQQGEFERMCIGFYFDGITLSVFELIYVVSIVFRISTRKLKKV